MSCADVCLSEGDGADFWTARHVRAKKQHKCKECGKQIVEGDIYERSAASSEGIFYSHATCAVCAEIRNAFYCGAFQYGRVWETIRGNMFPVWREKGPFDCLAKLTTPDAVAKCNLEYREWLSDNQYDEEPTGAHHAE